MQGSQGRVATYRLTQKGISFHTAETENHLLLSLNCYKNISEGTKYKQTDVCTLCYATNSGHDESGINLYHYVVVDLCVLYGSRLKAAQSACASWQP